MADDQIDATLRQIGERFRHAREDRAMTQAEVAAPVGLTRASVANFEAGRQDVPTSKLIALCETVGIGLAKLIDVPAPCPTCGCAWRGPR